jgi:murein DD-endopeptidase MepM/ murein hydrolase activator NlpD
MRRLMPTARAFLTHSGQTAAMMAVAVMAMAAAPATPEVSPTEVPYPVAEVINAPPVTAELQPIGPVIRKIMFQTPVRGHAVNSRFGMRRLGGAGRSRPHKGVDIAAPMGTDVLVAAEGEVIRTGYDAAGYGNFIEVRHPNGMTTLYAHLSRSDVSTGSRLSAGERIGLIGSTGYSTGPHLHFEVRRDGVQVNPTRILGQSFDVAAEA